MAVGRWWRSAVMSNQTRTPNATTSPNVIRLAAIRVAAIGLATLGLALLTSTGFTATALAVEPTLALTEDGYAFVYKSRPGDQPGSVAAMFGIAPRDMPAFFAANGITDPTHVGIGHVYRIPNPLAQRAAQAEAQAQAFARDVASLKTRTEQLGHELDGARTAAADAEQRVAHLARYERLWPLVSIVGILLVISAAALGWLAYGAVRKTQTIEQRAHVLADELDEKRRQTLADRQQSAKRILDLETKLRTVEQHAAVAARPPVRPAGTG